MPATLMIAGYTRHDGYQVDTAILCGEAYADSAIVDLAMKAVTRRERPIAVPAGGSFDGTFFSGGQSPFRAAHFRPGMQRGCFR